MHFDTILNLAWLLLGLALAATVRAICFRAPIQRQTSRWLHVIGVAVIVAALFPYISATDDVLRIEHSNRDSQHPSTHKQSDNLMWLYDTSDSTILCSVPKAAFLLFFISILFTPVEKLIGSIVPFHAGRSPPTVHKF